MQKEIIATKIGDIAVYIKNIKMSKKTPLIFLHGVYFDHKLWSEQVSSINDRMVIAVDMPYHGESNKNIAHNWTLNDCASMLLEILYNLEIKKVIAIGHSWGSMTILRAAHIKPDLFSNLVLCNMPFKRPGLTRRLTIRIQEIALLFNKNFYIEQAGKSLFSANSLSKKPSLIQEIIKPMSQLTRGQIAYTNKAVIINSLNTEKIIKSLKVPALALVGIDDYVGKPPLEKVAVAKGGHISPLEDPITLNKIILSLI